MKIKNIILGIAVLAMASCGTLKDYDRSTQVAELNTQGLFGDAESGDSLGLGDLKWREIFTDPTLQNLIERVLKQNTNMVNADLQIQEIQYALTATKLAFLPSISLSANGNTSRPWDPYNRMEYNNNLGYGVSLTMGWQNVNFLQLRNAKKGAQISLQQMRFAQQAIQASLVANTATLYYTLAQLDQQLILMQQTQANWAEYLKMERLLMDAGQANTAVVASIEGTYWSICQSVVTLKDNIRVVENQITSLLGDNPGHISRTALDSFTAPAIVTTGAPVSILSRRPDVRVSEMKLAKAFYDMNSAKAAFYPSLTLSATGQFTNSLGTSVINPGVMIGNAVASLAQPIFANGKIRAQYKISKAELEIAKNNFINDVVTAGNEVNTAMVQVKSAQELRTLIDNQVKAMETAYDANRKLYASSAANYLNVITAHNNLLQAQMTQISNRMDAIRATVKLYQALGGGAE